MGLQPCHRISSKLAAILVVLVYQYVLGRLVTWKWSKGGSGCLTGNQAGWLKPERRTMTCLENTRGEICDMKDVFRKRAWYCSKKREQTHTYSSCHTFIFLEANKSRQKRHCSALKCPRRAERRRILKGFRRSAAAERNNLLPKRVMSRYVNEVVIYA